MINLTYLPIPYSIPIWKCIPCNVTTKHYNYDLLPEIKKEKTAPMCVLNEL